ncbi:MAG TPA: MFS transporter [Caulobacter sp.]|nr:MFS transporter [Caulobacter sp.]
MPLPPAGRLPFHYAYVVLGTTFLALLAAAGLRAAPGVLILPLQLSFGWDRATVSACAALGIFTNGLVGPFAAALMQTYGIRRVMLAGLAMMAAATFASLFMTQAWQYLLTWGLITGVGSGAVAGVLAAAVVNRWFASRQGLMMGVLTASTSMGSLIFLPTMAALSQSGDWRPVVWLVSLTLAILIPAAGLLMRERPADLGLRRHGEAIDLPAMEPVSPARALLAVEVLLRACRTPTFWLLFAGFFVCGLTTNGLIGTHLIAYCGDRGIPAVAAAGLLSLMGLFDLVGGMGSGWLADRYNPRKLMFAYFSLRGLSLLALPFMQVDPVSLTLFAVFFGLDWIATVPPTLRLTNARFGEVEGPIVYGWIFTGHQAGAATAAVGAGLVRQLADGYFPAFLIGGLAALLMAVVFIAWPARRAAPATA